MTLEEAIWDVIRIGRGIRTYIAMEFYMYPMKTEVYQVILIDLVRFYESKTSLIMFYFRS